jgi:predicted Zn-dependent protease
VAGHAPQTSFLRGEANLIQRKTNSAIDDWSESVRLRENQAAERRLAQTYRQQPEVEQEHLAKMLLATGIDACEEGDPENTAAAMTESLKLEPEQSMAWYFLGEARRVQGKDGPAREAYQHCLEIDPDHGRAREALAVLDSKPETAGESDTAESEPQ